MQVDHSAVMYRAMVTCCWVTISCVQQWHNKSLYLNS